MGVMEKKKKKDKKRKKKEKTTEEQKSRNKTETTDGQKNRKKEQQIEINKIINFSRVNTTIREGANAFKTYLSPSAGFFQVDAVSRK